jgi:hypothetical protein
MPTEPLPPTLFEVVNAACDVVDPTGQDADVAEFFARFEDRDEPVTAILPRVAEELAVVQRSIDVDGGSENLQHAVAVATYLAFAHDELHELRRLDRDKLVERALKWASAH